MILVCLSARFSSCRFVTPPADHSLISCLQRPAAVGPSVSDTTPYFGVSTLCFGGVQPSTSDYSCPFDSCDGGLANQSTGRYTKEHTGWFNFLFLLALCSLMVGPNPSPFLFQSGAISGPPSHRSSGMALSFETCLCESVNPSPILGREIATVLAFNSLWGPVCTSCVACPVLFSHISR